MDTICYTVSKGGDILNLISSFQERLKEAMNGMSVTDLAAELDISKQSVSAYVNGTRKPKRLTISAMAQILSVNPAWLMGYDVEKHIDELENDTMTSIVLTDSEQYLLDGFRELTKQGQDYMIQTLHMALHTYKKAADPTAASAGNVG